MTREERDELRRLDESGTQGKWELWESNSWRRIGVGGNVGKTVIEPTVHHRDGTPDLHANPEDLAVAVAARNALPKLLDALDAAECTLDDEEAAHAETLQMLDAANAEIERLRAALQQVADTPRATSITTARSIARKALETP